VAHHRIQVMNDRPNHQIFAHDTHNEAPTAATGSARHRGTTALLRRLPRWFLWPLLGLLAGLLAVDLVVADPLPLVDEAALVWALAEIWRALRAPAAQDAPGVGGNGRDQAVSDTLNLSAYSRL
jgi:hypothetical protein